MAINIYWKIAMTDSEFIAINGRAVTAEENAGKFPPASVFTNLRDQSRSLPYTGHQGREAVTAQSSAGSTVIYPMWQPGIMVDNEVLNRAMIRVVRAAKEKGYTVNYTYS